MPRVKIANLGTAGLVKDIIPEDLPPEVFTDARNVRFTSQGAKAFSGHRAVFTPAPFVPTWIKAFPPVAKPLWVYAGVEKVGVFDGSGHFDISRTSLPYTAQTRWQGEVFNGVGIFNNPANAPQYWSAFDPRVKLINLPNFPQGIQANFVRPFKNFLIAGHMIEAGNPRPFRVRWSHPAAPGTVPASWDIADPSKLAGEIDLALTPDYVIDGLTLGDLFVVYKERSAWAMQLNLASGEVFDNWLIHPDRGTLFRDCVQAFPKGHFVTGQDDIYVHTGLRGSDVSIVEDRTRKWVFQQIDDQAAFNCFTFSNKQEKEIWFCFPEAGEQYATMALVWNWVTGAVGIRELPGVPFISGGVVDEELELDIWGTGEAIGAGIMSAGEAILDVIAERNVAASVLLPSAPAVMEAQGHAQTVGWPTISNPQHQFFLDIPTDAGPVLLSQLPLINTAGDAEARYYSQASQIVLNLLPGVTLGGEYPGPLNTHAALNLDNVFPGSVIYVNMDQAAVIGAGGTGGRGGEITASYFPEKFSWGGNGLAGKPSIMVDAVCYMKVSGGKVWGGGSGGGGAGGTGSEPGGGGGGGVGGRPGAGAGVGGSSPLAGAEGTDATSPDPPEDAVPGLGFTGSGAQDSAGGSTWGIAAPAAPEGPNPGSGGLAARSLVVPVGTTLLLPGVDERGSTQFFGSLSPTLSTNVVEESVPNGQQVVGFVDVDLINVANDVEPRIFITQVGGDLNISAEHVRTGGVENRVYITSTGTDIVREAVFQLQVVDAARRTSNVGLITVTVTHGSGAFHIEGGQGDPGVISAEIVNGVGPYLYLWKPLSNAVTILSGQDTSTIMVQATSDALVRITITDVGRGNESISKIIEVARTL